MLNRPIKFFSLRTGTDLNFKKGKVNLFLKATGAMCAARSGMLFLLFLPNDLVDPYMIFYQMIIQVEL